ncbi:hypothetical protein C8R47DRAFT_150839 [Mycena vitilis]|nr:hypothetical protein C8R47DRAFT_150839 [Mycena vitilis]
MFLGKTSTRCYLIIHNWIGGRRCWGENICSTLAWGYIRISNMISTGRLPATLPFTFPWGRVIRGSPPSSELLRAIEEFVPYLKGQKSQAEQGHNVIMWLKKFADRPDHEIHRWETFKEKQENRPSGNYEARWRQWDQDYNLSRVTITERPVNLLLLF